MTAFDGGWPPDFPKVMHFTDHACSWANPWRFLVSHPDYNAAKNSEDRRAALRLVRDFLETPENRTLLRSLKSNFPDAVVVPVHASEATGKNRIPEMLAEYMAKRTALQADTGIVQTNRTGRTGSGPWRRLAFRPEFDGPVSPGRNYILVDDVFTCGGSFSELRRHIERNGGRVVQAAAVSCGGFGDDIALRQETLKRLLDKFGGRPLYSFLKEINVYGGNFKALAEPEAAALGRAASLGEARDRIAEARQAAGPRNCLETARGPSAPRIEKRPAARGGFRP
jgi:hypothetical protein